MTENTLPAGTPDDWWEAAQPIMESEAAERNLGAWYITKVRTAGDTKPNYRLSTPSKPPNMDKRLKLATSPHFERESIRVRCLIPAAPEAEPAWVTAQYVIADVPDQADRQLWVRRKSGKWGLVLNGNKQVNDHTMAELNPAPARVVEDDLI